MNNPQTSKTPAQIMQWTVMLRLAWTAAEIERASGR